MTKIKNNELTHTSNSGTSNVVMASNGDITTARDLITTGDLTVTGNDIKSSGATAITMSGANVTVAGTCTATGGFVGGGKILQVVQTVKTDTFSHEVSDTSFHSTGFQVSITPTKASSKILLMYSVHIGSDTNNRVYLQIQRSINAGSYTAIGIGDTISNRFRATTGSMLHHGGDTRVHAAHYLDSPSYSLTNAIIYRLYGYVHATQYFYINRSHNNNDDDSHATPISTITAIEVGA
tara:strand:+ start:76 stop:786 length:711 start_codon:yes stop_codon:yes gene_type:complete